MCLNVVYCGPTSLRQIPSCAAPASNPNPAFSPPSSPQLSSDRTTHTFARGYDDKLYLRGHACIWAGLLPSRALPYLALLQTPGPSLCTRVLLCACRTPSRPGRQCWPPSVAPAWAFPTLTNSPKLRLWVKVFDF